MIIVPLFFDYFSV